LASILQRMGVVPPDDREERLKRFIATLGGNPGVGTGMLSVETPGIAPPGTNPAMVQEVGGASMPSPMPTPGGNIEDILGMMDDGSPGQSRIDQPPSAADIIAQATAEDEAIGNESEGFFGRLMGGLGDVLGFLRDPVAPFKRDEWQEAVDLHNERIMEMAKLRGLPLTSMRPFLATVDSARQLDRHLPGGIEQALMAMNHFRQGNRGQLAGISGQEPGKEPEDRSWLPEDLRDERFPEWYIKDQMRAREKKARERERGEDYKSIRGKRDENADKFAEIASVTSYLDPDVAEQLESAIRNQGGQVDPQRVLEEYNRRWHQYRDRGQNAKDAKAAALDSVKYWMMRLEEERSLEVEGEWGKAPKEF